MIQPLLAIFGALSTWLSSEVMIETICTPSQILTVYLAQLHSQGMSS